jgi:ketosteroid isomerase-like protein
MDRAIVSRVSRRKLLAVGASALLVSVSRPNLASASTSAGQNPSNNPASEELLRNWYGAWEKKDLGTFNALLTDDFTFTSAAGDDHISKGTFKTRCWDTQVNFIDHVDLERISAGADDAFVKYLGHTRNGKSFRNVEYFQFRNGKIQSLECYFGDQSNFPSAVSTGQK